MRKIEIEFSSQSKSVVSKVNVIDDQATPDEVLELAKSLCIKAEKFALEKSFERNK